MNNFGKFDPYQAVSSYLAIILLLALSFAVAWISVTKAEKIIDNAKESVTFNPKIIEPYPGKLPQEKVNRQDVKNQ